MNPEINNLEELVDFNIINPNQTENFDDIANFNDIANIAETNDELIANSNKINIQTNSDIVYHTILDELYDIILDGKNLFSRQNYVISKPDIIFENKKTIWINFKKNCEQINRTMYQVQKYITKELTAETSINDKGQLIIRGRYDIINLIKQYKSYIKNYVECSACKSFNTEIYRNSSNRLDYLKCLNEKPKCNYSRVVIKI